MLLLLTLRVRYCDPCGLSKSLIRNRYACEDCRLLRNILEQEAYLALQNSINPRERRKNGHYAFYCTRATRKRERTSRNTTTKQESRTTRFECVKIPKTKRVTKGCVRTNIKRKCYPLWHNKFLQIIWQN